MKNPSHLSKEEELPTWYRVWYVQQSLEEAISILTKKYKNNEVALQVFEDSQNEINLYKKFSDYYGYEFFIMQRIN